VDDLSERWRPIQGFAGCYEVSDRGRIKSLTRTVRLGKSQKTVRERILRPIPSNGYHWSVHLSRDGKQSVRLIHQLVLEEFVGPKPEGMMGCHNNGDGYDNRLENLRWDTPSANSQDTVRHGAHHEASKTHCPKKHPYSPENTRMRGRKRVCKTCHRERESARYYRNMTRP